MTRYLALPPANPGEGLPPLPPMYGAELFCGDFRTYAYQRGQLHKHHGGTPLYTQEQMWAYAKAAIAGVSVVDGQTFSPAGTDAEK